MTHAFWWLLTFIGLIIVISVMVGASEWWIWRKGRS